MCWPRAVCSSPRCSDEPAYLDAHLATSRSASVIQQCCCRVWLSDESACRGFQLLAKMGYKAGEGIGKEGKGRAAPITVDLKASRTGLGVDEDRKRKQESYKQLQELKSEPCTSTDSVRGRT